MQGPIDPKHDGKGVSYEDVTSARVRLGDYVEPFEQEDVYQLPNVGNNPSFVYILRNRDWKGDE